MSEIHWDQLGFAIGIAGFALHWFARIGVRTGARSGRSLQFLALAMMTFGAWGILTVTQGTPGAGEIVRQGLLLLALSLVVYFLWRAWQHWPR